MEICVSEPGVFGQLRPAKRFFVRPLGTGPSAWKKPLGVRRYHLLFFVLSSHSNGG